MTETAVAAPAAATPKPKKAAKGTKPKTVPTHPPVAQMVKTAIGSLKERNGSSLQAIKKYIAANYKVDIDRLSPFIRKHLKSAVTKGVLIQSKGKGASGSFKLKKDADKEKAAKVAKKPKKEGAAKKPKTPKKEGAKKVKSSKPKAAKPSKPKAAKIEKKAKKPKSPKKPKAKSAASPAKKAKPAKSPKKAAKKPAAKKAAKK